MAAPAICSPRCSPFYSPVSALSFPPLPASPFVFFSHPSRGRLSRGLARPITGCPPIHLFLPFSLFFLPSFLSFFPFPRKRTPVAVPSRFSFATSTLSFIYSFINGEKRVFENFEFYTNSWNSKNFVSTIPQANRFSFRYSISFRVRQRVWFFRRLFDGRKFLVGSETLGI